MENSIKILIIILILFFCIYLQNKIESFEATNNLESYDIFIIAGQSNSVGYGTRNTNSKLYGSIPNNINDSPQNNIQMYLNNGNIIPAVNPINHLHDFTNKIYEPPILKPTSSINCNPVGFGLSFAKDYIASKKTINSKVLLVGCGHGGTGFSGASSLRPYWWRPTDKLNYTFYDTKTIGIVKSLYLMTKQKITEMKNKVGPNSKVVGILWHQGESDSVYCGSSATNKTQYISYINKLFSDLRNDIRILFPNSSNVPILLGGLSPELVRNRKDYKFIANYNQDKDMTYFIQNSVVPSIPNAYFVSSSPIPNSPFNTYLEGDNELDSNGNPYKNSTGTIIRNNRAFFHLSASSQRNLGKRYYYIFSKIKN